jgi:hypothetical protein
LLEEFVELGGIFAREDDVAAAEAVSNRVGGGGPFAFGGSRTGGKLGIGAVGGDLGLRGHDEIPFWIGFGKFGRAAE